MVRQVMRSRHEEMRREDLGDHRARDGQRRQARAGAAPFVLQPGVRQGGQHDVAMPADKRAALEVIEPELVFQLLVLLFDRPALMRRAGPAACSDAVAGSATRYALVRGVAPEIAFAAAARPRARAGASRQSWAGVTRSAAKWAAHGRFVPLRHVTRRHARGRQRRGDRAHGFGPTGVRELQARGRTARARRAAGTATGGVPRKTVSVDETPSAYGSCRRCNVRRSVALSPNSASPSTAVTSKPAARIWRSSVSAKRHFSWKRTVAGNPRALPRLGRQPLLGQIQAPRPPSTRARPSTAPRSPRLGNWRSCPSVPQYWRATPTERRPCFGKLVPSRISTPAALGDHGAQLPPHALGAPRRVGDEVLKRLIRAGIADALEHRAHRLAPTVAQQAEQIATKRAALRDVREADLERLEPRRSTDRATPAHCAAVATAPSGSVPKSANKYKPFISIPVRSRSESVDLTKSVLVARNPCQARPNRKPAPQASRALSHRDAGQPCTAGRRLT